MTDANVKSLYADGQEIASHTITHDDMTTETAATLKNELSESQSTLAGIIGAPVTDMAYPYGEYNTAVQAETKDYYTGARGVEDGLNSKDNFNAMDLKVQNIYNTTTTAQVADWVAQAQATNTWLIFVYHSVDPDTTSDIDGGIYNVTPTQLTDQLAAIKASGVVVETMKQALAEVTPQL
jgi:peptidoglycan/xylan/chitin deacetylase (PgdA/CDA1 family)